MTITDNQINLNSVKTKAQKLNFFESLFYPLLMLNFAIAVKIMQWREDRYMQYAASITTWQIYFLFASVIIWAFPAIRTTNDIYWISATLVFGAFSTLFGMNKWLQSLIYKSRMGSKISKKTNLEFLNTLGIILFVLCFLIFSTSVVLKAYMYHTRFFWWNH
jgi:hypothetical protein